MRTRSAPELGTLRPRMRTRLVPTLSAGTLPPQVNRRHRHCAPLGAKCSDRENLCCRDRRSAQLQCDYFGGAAGARRWLGSDFFSLGTRFCSRLGACPVVSVRPRFSCSSPVRLPSLSSLVFLRSAAPASSCSAPLVVTPGDAGVFDPSFV